VIKRINRIHKEYKLICYSEYAAQQRLNSGLTTQRIVTEWNNLSKVRSRTDRKNTCEPEENCENLCLQERRKRFVRR
jgi:predicted GNAT superfamily acetyltransferase